MKKFLTTLTFFLAAMAVYASSARAQSVSKSFTMTINGGTRAPVPTAPFPNVGQSFNQVYACITVTAGTSITADLEIEASFDGSDFFAISPAVVVTNSSGAVVGGCASLSANGYYAATRLLAFDVAGTGTLPAGTIIGTYSGSVGVSAPGGEARAGTAAQKVSAIPYADDFKSTTLKSTGQTFAAAPTLPSGLFIYTVMVDNPNTTAVYLAFDTNVDPLFSDAGSVLSIPIPATTITTINLPAPAYYALQSSNINIACSSSPTVSTDPASACIVSVLSTIETGANSNVSLAGQINQTDNSSNVIPH